MLATERRQLVEMHVNAASWLVAATVYNLPDVVVVAPTALVVSGIHQRGKGVLSHSGPLQKPLHVSCSAWRHNSFNGTPANLFKLPRHKL